MSLGVLNNIAAIYAENNLNQTQASLQNTLTQLSSGSRINSGADDAAGLSVVDGLQANVAALTQSTENASDGIGLLQTADGALSQVTNLLNRAVTLATEAANGTLDTQQVSSANQEYQNILSEIGDIGSTTNFNGTTAFSSTAKAVFVSDGSSAGSNTYNEITGALSDSSVGVSSPGTASLSIPTASAPVGTTTVGAVAATTANSVSAVAGTPTPGATLTAVTGATSTGATASTPSSLTTVGLTSGETLTGTIEVQDGSNGLVSATLSGQSGQAAVNILNAAFGYNNTTGQFGASGLEATYNSTNFQITIQAAPGTTSAVSISSPTYTLANGGTAIVFNGASDGGLLANAGVAGTVGTATSTLGLNASTVASGSFSIVEGGSTVATVNLGSNQTLAEVEATLAASNTSSAAGSLGAAGYTASINGSGNLVVTGPTSNGANEFSIVTSSLSTLSSSPVSNVTSTGATVVAPSSLSTNNLQANSTLTGTIQVQAGSNSLVTVTLTNATVASAVTQLDTAFGYNETTNTFGASGLHAVANGNQLEILSAAGSGNQVTLSVPTTSVVDSANSNATVTFGNNTGGSAGVAAVAGSATLAVGATNTNLVAGNFTVSEGGSVLGTVNLGTTGYNQSALPAALTAALTTAGLTALGYTGSVSSGNIVITAPTSNGANQITLTPTTLETGTSGSLTAFSTTPVVSTNATGGTASTITSTGLTANTLLLGTLEVQGGTTAPISVALGNNGTGITLAAAVTALNTAFGYNSTNNTFGASGLKAVASGNQLEIAGNPITGDTVAIVPSATTLTDTYDSTAVSFGSGTTVTTQYGSLPTGATAGTATLALGLGANVGGNPTGNTVSGSITITEGGSTVATLNLGTNQTEAEVLQTIAAANASTTAGSLGAAGYTASINGSGNLVITGPTANGTNEFTVTGTSLTTTPTAAAVLTAATLTTAPLVTTSTGGTATIGTTAAGANTTYTGQFSYNAVGTTTAGTYTATGQTAAQIVAALNTANYLGTNAATGLQASVVNNEIVISGPTGSVTGSQAADTPTITLGTGSNVFVATPASTTTYTASTGVFAPTNADGTFSGEIQVGTDQAGGIATQTTTVAAETTLANLVTQLNNQYISAGVGGPTGLTASAGTGSQAGDLIITGPTPANNASAQTAANDTLIFGAGTDLVSSTSTVGVDFTQASVSQLTANSAQNVLTAVTTAINDVAYQRGIIGADVNELTAASNVAAAESVNLTSAQSSIQSTDYGAATSNLAKYQVLSQTGISALAQANAVQQEVLKLLQ